MKNLLSIHWALVVAGWYFINGVLHDIFVLTNHKGKYDRELLRLLMDGHVLMLSGVVVFVCYLAMLRNMPYAAIISIVVAVFMLLYCAMIFPFLKSIGTIIISLVLIVVSVKTMV